MNSNLMFSIIICVYNGESTIDKSINSVLCQKFKSYEIIVVNDGSTDHTAKKLAEIKSDKLKIFTQNNQGTMGARKSGLKLAKGKYVLFLDADDSFTENSLSILAYKIKKFNYPDCVLFKLFSFNENSLKIYREESNKNDYIVTSNELIITRYYVDNFYYSDAMKLFNRKYIEKILNIPETFDSTIYAEDILISSIIVTNSEKILIISDLVYNYFINSESVTHQRNIKYFEEAFNSYYFAFLNITEKYGKARLKNSKFEISFFGIFLSYLFHISKFYNFKIAKSKYKYFHKNNLFLNHQKMSIKYDFVFFIYRHKCFLALYLITKFFKY